MDQEDQQKQQNIQKSPRTGFLRILSVLKLFAGIFWSFYSLRFKDLWHQEGWLEKRKAELCVSQAVFFRETAIDLGGLLIKLGQFLSIRLDMLPPASVEELAKLQDGVKEVDFAELRVVAERELKQPLDQVFAHVDPKPIAAASLGQVHKVVLKSGEVGALKIQRPGIEELIAVDVRALKRVVQFIKRFTDWERFMDIDTIFTEFADTVKAELDYVQEGKNAERIKGNFQDEPGILIPKIYWEYSTNRLLAMEFVQGIKVNNLEAIIQAKIDPIDISHRLLQIYIKQILIDGFYHADPHPGNVLVAEGNQIILLDFGMVGEVDEKMRDLLMATVVALVTRDYAKVTEYLRVLGFINNKGNEQALVRALSIFLEQLLGQTSDSQDTQFQQMYRDLEELLYEQPFQLPAHFNFLGRALGTIHGICLKLNPDISFIDEAKPFVEQIAPTSQSIWKVVKDKATSISLSLVELPLVMERVLNKADLGDLELCIQAPALRDEIAANTRALLSLAYSIAFGCTFLGGTYLLVNQFHWPSHFCHGLSFIFFLLFLRHQFSRKHRLHPSAIKRKKSARN